MSHKILRKPDVLAKLAIKETLLKKMLRSGAFPRPILIGGDDARATGWLESEIDAWIDQKVAEHDAANAEGGVE
ncbi:helix-turn-helix transcriptional regulator [Methylomonas sp. 2BW1-5-20]|uniref:helix-turn-helix transcriptional regulator n=1 Tax=Methylomonas sp. 2BW1-5-20 TaxID=3376686 RepID=UPI004051BBE2